MKLLRLFFLSVMGTVCAHEPIELTIAPQSCEPLQLRCIAEEAPQASRTRAVAHLVGQLLMAGRQFVVTVESAAIPTAKNDIAALAAQGIPLACFFTQDEQAVSWRLYDVFAAQLLSGKKTGLDARSDVELAIHIADQLWQELTSQKSAFCSLVAACKHVPGAGRLRRALCLIHPFLSVTDFAPVLLVDRGNNFAPRWHRMRPSVIFYSYHTPTNIRLMSIDTHYVKRVITNFDGQNITPAIAADGTVVLALSVHDAVQLFLYTFDQQTKKSLFTQLTHEKGDCVSPSFVTNDQVVFCHIDTANRPRLGLLTLSTRTLTWLSVGATYCPMANNAGTAIAYCKCTSGVNQLFVYDLANHRERQLTHDRGQKDECSWSPCDNYIVCSVESGATSRIARVDVASGHIHFITPVGQNWSSPCWSPFLSLPFSFVKMR